MHMKRREFTLGAAAGLALTPSAFFPPLVRAQGTKPIAGKDYEILDQRAPVDSPVGTVEVVEFFSYMCHVCNAFEPTFHAWTKNPPKSVVVRRVPVPFLPNFELMQRLYYAIDAMGLVDKLHGSVFAAVHNEHRNLSSEATIADWVATQGVNRSKFIEQFNSFAVVTKTARAKQLASIYSVDRVPLLGVGGRFLTEGSAKGLQVVEALVGDLKAVS